MGIENGILESIEVLEVAVTKFQSGDIFGMLIPLIIMIAVFYFLLIRPQNKQRKILEQKINSLKKGDKFLTTGGLYLIVVGIKDNIVVGRMGDNVKVEVSKAHIADVVGKDISGDSGGQKQTPKKDNFKVIDTKEEENKEETNTEENTEENNTEENKKEE